MNAKNTKKRLVASLLAMAMCFTMLIGSTFAWFTDTASTSVNRIHSGILDIELYRGIYSEDNYLDNPDSYEELGEESLIPEDILWEPGYLWYDNLIVRNVGNLHAKFKATLVPTSEVGKLADVIDVYVSNLYAFVDTYGDDRDVRGYINGDYKGTGSPWDAFDALNPPKKIGTLSEVIKNQTPLFSEGDEELGLMPNGGENMVCIALKMQESAGNEYQDTSAGSFDIVISATQDTVEEDSYNNQYDKNALYPVTGKNALDAALANPNINGVVVDGGEYNNTVTVPENKTVISDKGIFDTRGDTGYAPALEVKNSATLVLNGGTYAGAGMQTINAQAKNSSVTINGGTYEGNVAVWACGTVEVIINDGIFNTWALAVTDSGAEYPVIVNGGTFNLGKGGIDASTGCPIVINGGTFNVNPTNWLGEGHTVTETNGIWTVK